ncbi:hypothetical protein FA09DRAFT_42080 [Tilletiopsis washingtonensis]|jgi:hypothetical protein|uniref:Uncharacterized protein n=1 Tax=Tilletiopsis washingtonensis TaxID=58919 RepID=A0A316Z9G9_9BASI|nr:hypothetical protein FA09DRAFT_42080 [Tilletiopsis washingtonensis]PWN97644.1 hypothetical protein FA09DRAFT_42080 [Tilletiopsis washingtonensis]
MGASRRGTLRCLQHLGRAASGARMAAAWPSQSVGQREHAADALCRVNRAGAGAAHMQCLHSERRRPLAPAEGQMFHTVFGGQHSNSSAMHAAAGSSAARAWPRRPRTRRRGWRHWRARESLGVSCRRGGLHGLPRPRQLAGTPHAAAACLGPWPNVYWASRNAAPRKRGRRGHMSEAARWTLGVLAGGLRCTSSRRAGTPAGTTSLVLEEPGSERGCVGAVGKRELPHAASPSVAAATPKRPRQGAGRASEARPCLRAQRTKKMLKHPGVQCKRWRLTGLSGRKALRGPLDPGVWTRPNAIPWRPAPDRYCTAFYCMVTCASASDLSCGKGRCANQINRHAPPASPASHGPPRPHAAAGSGGTSERREAEAGAAV